MHFAMDSNLLHKESDEARRQLAQLEGAESSESESEEEEEGQGEANKEEVCVSALWLYMYVHTAYNIMCMYIVHAPMYVVGC